MGDWHGGGLRPQSLKETFGSVSCKCSSQLSWRKKNGVVFCCLTLGCLLSLLWVIHWFPAENHQADETVQQSHFCILEHTTQLFSLDPRSPVVSSHLRHLFLTFLPHLLWKVPLGTKKLLCLRVPQECFCTMDTWMQPVVSGCVTAVCLLCNYWQNSCFRLAQTFVYGLQRSSYG